MDWVILDSQLLAVIEITDKCSLKCRHRRFADKEMQLLSESQAHFVRRFSCNSFPSSAWERPVGSSASYRWGPRERLLDATVCDGKRSTNRQIS
jgi:hypothetical protein